MEWGMRRYCLSGRMRVDQTAWTSKDFGLSPSSHRTHPPSGRRPKLTQQEQLDENSDVQHLRDEDDVHLDLILFSSPFVSAVKVKYKGFRLIRRPGAYVNEHVFMMTLEMRDATLAIIFKESLAVIGARHNRVSGYVREIPPLHPECVQKCVRPAAGFETYS